MNVEQLKALLADVPNEVLAEAMGLEQSSNVLYLAGKLQGFPKVTDKSKWREPVMAEKLGHVAHEKISAGKDSEAYGSDAYDPSTGRMAEYKSNAIGDKEARNLRQELRPNGTRFALYTAKGVYNGAYTHEAIDAYAGVDHYFGIFHEELCVLIVKVDTTYVANELRNILNEKEELRRTTGRKITTNCNTVQVHLERDKDNYEIAYINEDWFSKNNGITF